MKIAGIVFLALIGITFLFASGHACKWLGGAMNVAQKEFGAEALLNKYMAFKDVHAALSSKKAQIDVLDKTVDQFLEDYKDVPKKDWPRDERQAFNQRRTEVAGLKLVFNTTAAQYNADMAKFNYAFCNAGTLPKGATEPLPREYITYVVE